MQPKTMDTVTLGERFTIEKIDDDCPLKKRLCDIGITKGAILSCLFRSPLGDPVAFRVCDTVVALRKSDCSKIEVMSLA